MTSKYLIKLLKKNGWVVKQIQGRHHIMEKGGQTEVVPFHNTDLKPGLLNAILKRIGLK